MIGERLEQLWRALGFSTKVAFAKHVGWSQQSFNNYTSGRNRISLDEAMKLRFVLGVSLDWVYLGDPSGLPKRVADALAMAPGGEGADSRASRQPPA